MSCQKSRRGFTFIELLFVIVVLGIVGGISLEAIRLYYEGIYRTQEYSKRVAEADHILEQVSKYFETAIMNSMVNLDKDASDGSLIGACDGALNNSVPNSDYTTAFLAADEESLHTAGTPGWSEDVNISGLTLIAADANYADANATIGVLFPSSNLVNSAVYDKNNTSPRDQTNSCRRYNWDNAGGSVLGVKTVNSFTATTLTLNNNSNPNAIDGTQKYLIRTGYAFRVADDGNFTMYSNFRPWKSEKYTQGKINVLGRNVASFSVSYNMSEYGDDPTLSDRGLVHTLKICMRGLNADLTSSSNVEDQICRERRVRVRY
jgi:prepilin-type N-terminal cleavage/methylation domain-containing protein